MSPAGPFTSQSDTILRQCVSHSLVRPVASPDIHHSKPHYTTAMGVSQSCSTYIQHWYSPLQVTPYYGNGCLCQPASTGINHSMPHCEYTTAVGVSHSLVRLIASTGIRLSMLHYATAVRVSQSCQPAVEVFAGCADVDCYEIRADEYMDSSGSPPPSPHPPSTDNTTTCTCCTCLQGHKTT